MLHPANHAFRRPPGYPLWTFACVRQGGSHLYLPGFKSTTQSQHCILIPPNTTYEIIHGVDNQPWLETYVLFSPPPEWLPLMDWPFLHADIRLLDFSANPHGWSQLIPALDNFVEAIYMPQDEGMPFRKNAFERVLLIANLHNPAGQALRRDQRVRDTVRHITDNLAKPTTVASLAKRVHLSPPRLAQLFKKETGLSLMQFVENQRITHASELLATTTLPIKQIAQLTGFENPFHFSTRFKRHTGKTPRAYRLTPTLS